MSDIVFDIFEAPFGWVGAVASSRGLRRTTLPQTSPDECVAVLNGQTEGVEQDPDRFSDLADLLSRYFEGSVVDFASQPLDVRDAPAFQQAAWSACMTIPYGETRPYKWLAARAGRPKAPRAAGQSMARNRLPLIVPCHRVVASDGTLRGFGKGAAQLDLKQRLLDLEAGRPI